MSNKLLLTSIVLFALFLSLKAQNPHGNNLTYDCKACHTSGSWSYVTNEDLFNHDDKFALEGQHAEISCVACHETLIFEETESSCVSCHTDVHSMSVGNDCARCHSTKNWLVDNIPELHEANGFPLLGAHALTACVDCHVSETNLRWERIGNECATCHMEDYASTQNPNHPQQGFSTDCTTCHDPFAPDWKYAVFYGHNRPESFPIAGGNHGPGVWNDCVDCHVVAGNYAIFSCIDCHEHNDPNDLAKEHDDVGGYQYNSIACLNCHPKGTEE